MSDNGFYSRSAFLWALITWYWLAAPCASSIGQDSGELVVDRLPFDRITLNAANDNAVLDVVLLDLPERTAPNPLPTSGTLELRQLSNPSTLYTVNWSDVAKVELYEELVLADAVRLTAAGESAAAFRTLQFLHAHYPDLTGLQEASEQYVKREALDAFTAKQYDEALAIMLSLYDINPQHRGLADAVRSVSDRVIGSYLEEQNFAAARSVLELLKQGFPDLSLPNITTWEAQFQQDAQRELAVGREAFEAGNYDLARLAVRRAEDIVPDLPAAVDLLRQIEEVAPQLMVGVNQLVTDTNPANDLEWSHVRVRRLTNPQLVQMVDFGAEGGVYASNWAALQSDDSGLTLDVSLTAPALRQGVTPEKMALELLSQANTNKPQYQADFAALFEKVSIRGGDLVRIHWRRPHVRPEALVRLSLLDLLASSAPPSAYRPEPNQKTPQQLRYILANSAIGSGPQTIVERVFDDEDSALAALRTGEVSILDQVPPWQADQLGNDRQISLGTYRLPTVHVLRLNYSNRLLGNREFRRALCYGIDRAGILRDLILAGEQRRGFRTITGPLPAGVTVTDPVGYAYNQQMAPRPYEPRLAAVLANVARTTLAKRTDDSESATEAQTDDVSTPPLVLVYAPAPVPRLCCEAIRQQLTAIGIPVELRELSNESSALPEDYDLAYAELAVHEPLVDARRLLGPGGAAGLCTPSMSLALEHVDQARNWREASERLQEVHRLAYYDLPMVPLWQTVDSFAYRRSLEGIGTAPVSLYQNVRDWRPADRGENSR